MLDELRNQDWFPRSIRRKARRIDSATQELEARLGRSPRDAELARHMLLDIQDFYRMVGEVSQSSLLSMDEDLRIGNDGTYSSVREMLSDTHAPDAHDHLADKELGAIVAETLGQLDGKERLVLTLYYYEELTLAEIGEVLGVSESRICQIHGKALQRLRMRVRAKTRENPLPPQKKLRRGRALTRL
jgi:RNA polymerase sigma factor for flagellar operon FliA